MQFLLIVLACCFSLTNACAAQPPAPEPERAPDTLTVMSWNIWHGGREDGADVGPERVIEVIRSSGADIIAMQETYGSGERIAEGLGFRFHPRGTNVSIHSRHPIVEDISVHEEFTCVGALIELPDASRVAFYSIWLPYSGEIWAEGTRDSSRPEQMLAACRASADDLEAIWRAIATRLAKPEYKDIPIIIAGDFNSMSHLDYGEVGWDQHHAVINWPTSRILPRHGFIDTYRATNPKIDRARDCTWSPRFTQQEQDRIDFIYARARDWRAQSSRVVRTHAERFPSDHAAVITTFARAPGAESAERVIRAASYNIKHGEGMDGRVDLERTAAVLADLEADIIGLQEVDLRVKRSGGINQVNELAQSISRHPAFGGSWITRAVDTAWRSCRDFRLWDVQSLRLPDGNEPRIALLVEVRLPDGSTMLVANVHFDWVGDDAYRFAQAEALAAHLRTRTIPIILLGDFNDQPGSRTIDLFRSFTHEALKPEESRFTFPSHDPTREIDFIWCAPSDAWEVGPVRVIAEENASDHRPIVADLILRTHSP
jgi:endonuclease/exonuclease/phosphatase family metal-dependent hydrolase